MTKRPTKAEFSVKIVLLAFFLLLIWESRGYEEESALFPRLLGAVTGILIVVSLTSDLIFFRKKGKGGTLIALNLPNEPSKSADSEVEGEVEVGYEFVTDRIRKKKLLQTLFLMLISLVIGSLGGFLWIGPFFFIAFGFLQGKPGKKFNYILSALVFTGVTYLFFVVLMGVPLLRGLWWG